WQRPGGATPVTPTIVPAFRAHRGRWLRMARKSAPNIRPRQACRWAESPPKAATLFGLSRMPRLRPPTASAIRSTGSASIVHGPPPCAIARARRHELLPLVFLGLEHDHRDPALGEVAVLVEAGIERGETLPEGLFLRRVCPAGLHRETSPVGQDLG